MTQTSFSPARRVGLRLGAMWALANLSACGGGNLAVAVLPGGGGTGAVGPPPPSTVGAVSGGFDIGFGVLGQNAVSDLGINTAGTAWRRAPAFNPVLTDPEGEGLQPGMLVQVVGALDVGGLSGVAADLRMRPALRGPVQSVSATGFVVANVGVLLSPATQWARGASAAQVRVGEVWQVHGHLQALGSVTTVLATRVVQGLNAADAGAGLVSGIASTVDLPQNNAKLRLQGVPYSLGDGLLRIHGLACAFAASVDPAVASIRNQAVQYNGTFSNAQFLVESASLS